MERQGRIHAQGHRGSVPMTSRVVCVHLLNDFSGSTRVLSQAIAALRRAGVEVTLHASAGSEGFLSGMDVVHRPFEYRRSHRSKLATLRGYAASQLRVFRDLWQYRDQDAVVLVNTLLPFGAGLAGRLMGKRVVYYVHETSIRPRLLKMFLSRVARHTASLEIFVSNYLREAEAHPGVRAVTIPNALTPEMIADAEAHPATPAGSERFVILMACSPRDYKGVPELLEVARQLVSREAIRFELVLNGQREEIDAYLGRFDVPPNVEAFPAAADVRPFYRRAHLVLNLSRPDEWIETFGLTLVEAMAYGIPVIAPPVGGPVEVVKEGETGFLINGSNTRQVTEAITRLVDSPELWLRMSRSAKERSRAFHPARFEEEIVRAVIG
ncbi:MAG: glycosyltransferase family 4 protein [Myxococcaceae bacterium]|nr:glycosyltransferase family 4 protein [Myxococcaceae bacterium]